MMGWQQTRSEALFYTSAWQSRSETVQMQGRDAMTSIRPPPHPSPSSAEGHAKKKTGSNVRGRPGNTPPTA